MYQNNKQYNQYSTDIKNDEFLRIAYSLMLKKIKKISKLKKGISEHKMSYPEYHF